METAIIGLGNIGARLAHNLVTGHERILVASHDHQKARAFAAASNGRATALGVADAIARAEIVVFCVWFQTIQELIEAYRDDLEGKIIVDPSNPIAPDGKGGFTKIIPEKESAGEMIAAMAPPRTHVVKAFGSISAQAMESAANRMPERAVLFYAADDAAAGRQVASLVSASGFAPLRVGGIDQSIRIEVFGDLHEFGKLGKLVSIEEARALI